MSQQQAPPMQNYPPQSHQQYPIYASGTSQQMNHQPTQNGGGPIYVPSSISIQNSLNNVATAPKSAPVPPPMMQPPQQNNNYGHGMMQQTTPQPQIPQYMPSLQQQTSIPGAPAPPPPPPAGFGNSIPPCPPPAPQAMAAPAPQASAGPPPRKLISLHF